MLIAGFPAGAWGTNCYLVAPAAGEECVIIDPGHQAAQGAEEALAIGFLLWGIVRQQRGWRIASLILMLAAVGKVFLFDASGLEGVTRIASFVALGLSLIGIGWLYARHLGADRAGTARA